MSKSLGNFVTVGELLDEGHKGETLRLALLSAHYRQPLEWSPQLIAQSKATLDRLYRTLLPPVTKRGEGDPARWRRRWPTTSTRRWPWRGWPSWPGSATSRRRSGPGPCSACFSRIRSSGSRAASRAPSDRVDPRLREESGFGLGAEIQLRIDRRAEAKKAPRLRRGRPHPGRAGRAGHLARGRPAGTTWRRPDSPSLEGRGRWVGERRDSAERRSATTQPSLQGGRPCI